MSYCVKLEELRVEGLRCWRAVGREGRGDGTAWDFPSLQFGLLWLFDCRIRIRIFLNSGRTSLFSSRRTVTLEETMKSRVSISGLMSGSQVSKSSLKESKNIRLHFKVVIITFIHHFETNIWVQKSILMTTFYRELLLALISLHLSHEIYSLFNQN
jgi:hypothetical protein